MSYKFTKASFIRFMRKDGVFFAAYMANACGVSLAQVQIWVREALVLKNKVA